jgi:hypothetical protein
VLKGLLRVIDVGFTIVIIILGWCGMLAVCSAMCLATTSMRWPGSTRHQCVRLRSAAINDCQGSSNISKMVALFSLFADS